MTNLDQNLKQLEQEVLKLNTALKSEKQLSKSLAEENNQLKIDLQAALKQIEVLKSADLQKSYPP